ncbi:MAG: TorF family putative porin [Pseudomonadota bacterium]
MRPCRTARLRSVFTTSFADYFDTSDEPVIYPYLDLSFPMSEKLSLDLHVGQQTFDDDDANDDGVADDELEDIVDYSVGLSADAGNGFTMGLAFVATDLDDDDPKAVVSGGYSFDL